MHVRDLTHVRAREGRGKRERERESVREKGKGEGDAMRSRVLGASARLQQLLGRLRIIRSRSPPFDGRARISSHAETGA